MYKKIINLTFYSVFNNKDSLIKSLFFPLLALIIIRIITEESQSIKITALVPALMIINLVIAVITHRILLLGDNKVPKWELVLSFFLNSLLMMLLVIPIALLAFIPIVGPFIAVIVVLVVLSRLSIIFPAISINKKITFSQAWKFTENYKLLTFFTVVIFPVVFSFIIGIVYNLVIGFLIGIISSKLYVLYPVLDVFIMVFVISALSATYKIIREEHPEFFEPKIENENEITITNNKTPHTIDINKYEINFESLKQELIKQYEKLGFSNTVIDKENSWMVKNPEDKGAYVALTQEDTDLKIETYNTKEADLDLILSNKEKVE